MVYLVKASKCKLEKEVAIMKTIINGKNYSPSDKLKATIEKKFEKLDKYFSNEITGTAVSYTHLF